MSASSWLYLWFGSVCVALDSSETRWVDSLTVLYALVSLGRTSGLIVSLGVGHCLWWWLWLRLPILAGWAPRIWVDFLLVEWESFQGIGKSNSSFLLFPLPPWFSSFFLLFSDIACNILEYQIVDNQFCLQKTIGITRNRIRLVDYCLSINSMTNVDLSASSLSQAYFIIIIISTPVPVINPKNLRWL